MPYLLSSAASTPNPASCDLVEDHKIPNGIEIPENWYDAYTEGKCLLPNWAPRFTDPPDAESRLGKDIEDLRREEFLRFKQTENFGTHIHQEDLELLET